MGGRIDYAPVPTDLARDKTPSAVYRTDGQGNFAYLPNVLCETVQERFGASPAVAQCRYTANQFGTGEYPIRIDDTMPLDSVGPYVVRPDDRIAVALFDPLGNARWIFEGFAKIPEAALGPNVEHVNFQAIGVAEREWDSPLVGSLWRDGSLPSENDNVVFTGIPARMNPDGLANATPDGGDHTFPIGGGSGGFNAPLFLDPLLCKSAKIGRKWSLSMAARYVIAAGYLEGDGPTYIDVPEWSIIDALLDSWTPVNGQTIDPTNPATYSVKPIILRDITVSGKAWPMALDELIRPHGFAMRFEVSNDENDNPTTRLILWKRDSGDGKRYKDVLLPEPGSDLEPEAVNLGGVHIARDTSQVANQVLVETKLLQHECTFVLAPGWTPLVSDAANKPNFRKAGNSDFALFRKKYRWWVLDETGDGHWSFNTNSWRTGQAANLSNVLGLDNNDPALWTQRRRPGKGTLISKDTEGTALKFTVQVCNDYTGPVPGVWDGTGGTWRAVKGDFSLLEDRCGIEYTGNDPNDLDVGAVGETADPFASRKLRLVEWISPATPLFKVYFRVTCVIEGDQRASVFLSRRASSITKFEITEHVDAKDRYETERISRFSENAPNIGADSDTYGRDDHSDALAEAQSRRAAVESAHLAGTLTIPRLTLAYLIGDRIRRIRGRDIDLQTNAGGAGGDPPTYPECVGRTFSLAHQSTSLVMSDARADHQSAI